MKYVILMTFLLMGSCAMAASQMNTSRLMLAHLRGGDYAHAGDEEAIDIVLKKVRALDPHIHEKHTLDVGCGFGGTAQYLKDNGFKHVQGIDTDEAAITYAQNKYPEIFFKVADAVKLNEGRFSFIYLFNVAYAIQDKQALLRSLSSRSEPGSILVLFDYAQGYEQVSEIRDLANKPMYPIALDVIEDTLNQTGWELVDIEDMIQPFINWYAAFLKKLEDNATQLEKDFSQEDIVKVRKTFMHILNQLQNKDLSGILIIARKIKQHFKK